MALTTPPITKQKVLSAIQRRGLKPDVITYTGLIQACSKGREPQKALSFLDAMKVSGVHPDAVAYSAAIEACARGQGLAPRALQLYEELLKAGFEPQPQVYRALVTACGEAAPGEGGGTKRVWEILQLCPPARRNNFVCVLGFAVSCLGPGALAV